MTSPVIAGRAPLGTEVEAGKTYYWCSCGQSTKQPFCDGSHKGSEFVPQAYTSAGAPAMPPISLRCAPTSLNPCAWGRRACCARSKA